MDGIRKTLTLMLILCFVISFTGVYAVAEEEGSQSVWDSVGGWFSQAREDTSNWTSQAWEDTSNWTSQAWEDTSEWASQAWEDTTGFVSDSANNAWTWMTGAANDAWGWTVGEANDAWAWTVKTANGTWDGVTGFFNPPSTEGTPSIVTEPELPEGTLKMYLGYQATKTKLDTGYDETLEIGKDDPHFGLSIGKFYVSGFTGVMSQDDEHFIFLKTVGDDVELHFELTQDIDMLGGDTAVTINRDNGGYDRQLGVSPTDFGRGTLIVRFTDYQNNTTEPQVYTDYLAAKMSGTADTVISLNEEGDYEIALDYEIKTDSRILGTAATISSFTNYRIHFTFSVRNGNCMVFPFDLATGEELKNTSIAPNGFRLDLARSRFLTINVKLSTLTEGTAGLAEDVRFNRPARDGEEYTREGIYTITVQNEYTGQETVKTLYVGSDERLIDYVTQGFSLEQIIQEINR